MVSSKTFQVSGWSLYFIPRQQIRLQCLLRKTQNGTQQKTTPDFHREICPGWGQGRRHRGSGATCRTKAEVEGDPCLWERTGTATEQQTAVRQSPQSNAIKMKGTPTGHQKGGDSRSWHFYLMFIWCCKQQRVARLTIIKPYLASMFIKLSFVLLVDVIWKGFA